MPRTPVQRCLRLLDTLVRQGTAFARRLHTAQTRPASSTARERANHLLFRALLALRHAATLAAKLAADPTYRGEPPRPPRPITPPPPIAPPSPPRPDTRRRRKPRPFEQVFAGRSVGQIVDHIRHDLGLPGRIAPLLDEHLARSPTPPPRNVPNHPPPRRNAPPLIPKLATILRFPAPGHPD